jgi:hypothetical protein
MTRPDPSQKRRTREHVIADMSRVHVETAVIHAGFTAEIPTNDYGYDLVVTTYDENGYYEPDRVFFQLKATDSIERFASGPDYVYQIDRRDHAAWTRERLPVYFVLYDARRHRGYWQHVQGYYATARGPRP